jgi:hypothetical protein
MTEFDIEPPQEPRYRVVETTVNDDWRGERTARQIEVNPELLAGFDIGDVSRETVATILSHTMNGVRKHGASALGLDLDSMRGSMYARGHIDAVIGVGASILNEVAARNDGVTWEEWIKTEFPNTIAALYGEGSDKHLIAQDVVAGDGSQTSWGV